MQRSGCRQLPYWRRPWFPLACAGAPRAHRESLRKPERDSHYGDKRNGLLIDLRRLISPLPYGVEGRLLETLTSRVNNAGVLYVTGFVELQFDDELTFVTHPERFGWIDRVDVLLFVWRGRLRSD